MVVTTDVNVIPRYSKQLMHVHKVQITNLDDLHLNLNLNSLLVKRQIDNPSPGAVTGGN